MPPSTRPTDPPSIHPSIHPPAAFSCSNPEAGALRRQLRRQIRPPSDHGRSRGRSVGRDIGPYEISPARRSRQRGGGGRKVRCSRTQALRRTDALPSLPPFLPLSFPSGRFGAVARHTIPQGSSPTPLAPSLARSAGCRSIIIIASALPPSLPPAARIWHRQMNSYSPSPSPRHRNGDRR